MPERERVPPTGGRQDQVERGSPLRLVRRSEIENRQRLTVSGRCILVVRRSRTYTRTRRANRSFRNERLAPVPLEANPAARDTQQAGTAIVNLQRVLAPEIDRGSGRRVDKEESRRRPDARVDCPSRERKPVFAAACIQQLQPGIRLHIDPANLRD